MSVQTAQIDHNKRDFNFLTTLKEREVLKSFLAVFLNSNIGFI